MPRTPLIALAAVVALIAALASVTSDNTTFAHAQLPPPSHLRDAPPSTMDEVAGAVEPSAFAGVEEVADAETRSRTTSTTIPRTATALGEAAVEQAESPRETDQEQPTNPTTTTTTAPTTTTTAPTTTTTEVVEDAPAEGSIDHAAESEFVGLINSLRSSNGQAGLTRDGSLDARARDWARYMAESGSLAHSDLGSLVPPWTAVAENLGQGGSVPQIFDLLAGSSGHLSNMLGDYTHVGVGVWRDANDVLWTTHVFAR